MIKYLYKNRSSKYRSLFFSAILFIFIASILEICKAYLFKIIFDRVSGENTYSMTFLVVLSLGLLFSFSLSSGIQGKLVALLKMKIRIGLREDLLASINSRIISKNCKTSEGISIFNNDIELLINSYFTVILKVFSLFSSFTLGVYFILKLEKTFLIPVIVCGILLISMTYITKNLLNKKQLRSLDSLKQLVYKVKGYFNSSLTIKNYHLHKQIDENFQYINREHALHVAEFEATKSYIEAINAFGVLGLFIGIKLMAVYMALIGRITVGDILFVVQTSNHIANPLFAFSTLAGSINSTKGVRKNIATLLQNNDKGIGIKALDKIQVENLSYKYEDTPVIENLNLTFNRGKKYLLTGESGSGKSTLIKLITKQLTDYEGKILIDGLELRKISEKSYFREIKLLNQNPEYINSSIKDNIVGDSQYIEDRYLSILRDLSLLEFIDSLKDGSNTILDEDSLNISGGQLQRVAIARALYSGSNFLVMDEPFSALDQDNLERIENLLLDTNLTLIIISHKNNSKALGRYDEVIDLNNYSLKNLFNKSKAFSA